MFGFRPNQADSYSEIYLTHLAAKELGTSISYNGIKEVNIRVSAGFESIPLTGQDDFCGAIFHITNTQSTGLYILFTLTGEDDIVPNSITLDNVRNGNYSLDNNKQYTLFVKIQSCGQQEEELPQQKTGIEKMLFVLEIIKPLTTHVLLMTLMYL